MILSLSQEILNEYFKQAIINKAIEIRGYLPSSKNDPSCFIDEKVLSEVDLLEVGFIFSLFNLVVFQPGTEMNSERVTLASVEKMVTYSNAQLSSFALRKL